MGKILRQYIEDLKENFRKNRAAYCPNSVYHGAPLGGDLPLSENSLLRMEIGRLDDFLEYLFDKSEHCNHITQSEAWKEFEEWEFKNK